MPRPLAIDRTMIAGLVLQGFTYAEIQRKTGVNQKTVATWDKRLRWSKSAAKARELVAADMLTKQSEQARSMLAAQVVCDVDAVDRVSDRGLPKLHARVRARGDVIANAREVFGWGDAERSVQRQAFTQVNIACAPSTPTAQVDNAAPHPALPAGDPSDTDTTPTSPS